VEKKPLEKQVLPFRVSLIGIFLFNMNVKDALLAVDGGQLEILQNEVG